MTNHAEHLLNLFHAAYSVPDRDRQGDTSIHVSNLINFCPRAYYLCWKHDRSFHGYTHHPIGARYTFDMGHAIQKMQVDRLMTQQVIFGAWECRHCKNLEVGMQDSKRACPKCKCRAWKHKDLGLEMRVPVPKTRTKPKSQIIIRGNADYVVATSASTGFIVDAKSIKAESFDDLVEPHIDYKRQVQLYMWLANLKDRTFIGSPRDPEAVHHFAIDPKHAVIAYSVKGARNAPIKTFIVEQDLKFVKKIEGRLKELASCISSDVEIDKICRSQADTMAKTCVARTLCFPPAIGVL